MSRPLSVFILAGEHSGDQLGFKLMRALRDLHPGDLYIRGVGGPRMEGEGLQSLFPMDDIAVMGIGPVIGRLPLLLRRIRETADAIVADPPNVLVIIDSPDFTHRVARRVRQKLPNLPIVDYVSPTVWAWRPGRAKKMRAYVDHVLALLPFEPAAHRRLGGPDCSYVGHPLVERLDEFRPAPGERAAISDEVRLLVLPGSRLSVVRRHMDLFGNVVARLAEQHPALKITLPTVGHIAQEIEALSVKWKVRPEIVIGEDEKLRAMRRANAALASSGTVTLELAVSGIPHVGAYRIDGVVRLLRPFVKLTAQHILLPNLILDRRVIPEFVAEEANAENLYAALLPLFSDTPERRLQEAGLAELDERMRVPDAPSRVAARVVLDCADKGRM